MLKARGGGAQLAKTFRLLQFNTTMINHNMKTTCQILLLTPEELCVGDLWLTPRPWVPTMFPGLSVHLTESSAVNRGGSDASGLIFLTDIRQEA